MTRRTSYAALHSPHKPVPKGWRKVGSAGAHRDQHAVLIELARADRRGRGATAPVSRVSARSTAPGASVNRKDRRGTSSEFALHCQVAAYLRVALTSMETWWTTIPAGGGGKIRGARLKRMGYRAGTPDILIVYRGMAHWIELKASSGRLSEAQLDVHSSLQLSGCMIATCRSLQEVYDTLCRWQLPLAAMPT